MNAANRLATDTDCRLYDLADRLAARMQPRDLLEQVASSPDEARAVRNYLSRPLTEADLDAAQRWREQPLPVADPWWVQWLLWPVVVVLTVAACAIWPYWVQP